MSWRRRSIAGLTAIAVLAVLAVAGGYNVAASSGHLPLMKPLFAWTLRNSVYWRALGETPPQGIADRRLPAGAGHYHLVCRQCHGAPGEAVPESLRHMVPAPPHASELARDWRPRELFWIVKHGIKMTAMPPWPTQQRNDEVWEVADFLRHLPQMERPAYEQAVGHEPVPPGGRSGPLREVLDRCAHCHGRDGSGPAGSDVPVIAGLGERYLRVALEAYRRGARPSGFMQVQAADLTTDQIDALARHFARQPTRLDHNPAVRSGSGAALAEAGRRIAGDGVPGRGVPACAACHGPSESLRAEVFPTLAGQRPDYLREQLELFRRGVRGGGEFAPLMTFVARHLTDRDIEALAEYYGSLGKRAE